MPALGDASGAFTLRAFDSLGPVVSLQACFYGEAGGYMGCAGGASALPRGVDRVGVSALVGTFVEWEMSIQFEGG